MVTGAADRIAEYRVAEFLDGEGAHSLAQYGPIETLCTIAVCTRDRPDDLDRCLTALHAMPDDGQEILVVDSASSGDATRDVVRRYPTCALRPGRAPGRQLGPQPCAA